MIVDLHETDSPPIDGEVDVCILGGGVAGITLAVALAERFRVVILEGGGRQPSVDSQNLYRGDIVGRDYFNLDGTRMRCLGGSSNHWGGWCRPLDEHDFEPKPYQEVTGWPIGRADLDPYLDDACDILDIPDDGRHGPDAGQINTGIAASGELEPIDFWWSGPTRFGRKYEKILNSHPNITCLLHANLTDIRLAESGDRVESFEFGDYRERRFSIAASRFVLAAGGIENPRLLLMSNRQMSEGIGNAHGLVGRYFTEHPHHQLGQIAVDSDVWRRIVADWTNFKSAMRFFSPSVEFMDAQRILNFGLRFQPSRTSAAGGVQAFVKDIICNVPLGQSIAEWVNGAAVSCFDAALNIASEQALNYESQVRLSDDVDALGLPRVVLDWKLSPLDRKTMREAALHWGMALAAADLGRLKVHDWVLSDDGEIPGIGQDETAGNHHLCTTRMAASPADGVVDATQRVFGTSNLHIAGSSVFSTGGHANPTLTIVQMTLRLADLLKKAA